MGTLYHVSYLSCSDCSGTGRKKKWIIPGIPIEVDDGPCDRCHGTGRIEIREKVATGVFNTTSSGTMCGTTYVYVESTDENIS